eukprot:gene19971-biopygen20566
MPRGWQVVVAATVALMIITPCSFSHFNTARDYNKNNPCCFSALRAQCEAGGREGKDYACEGDDAAEKGSSRRKDVHGLLVAFARFARSAPRRKVYLLLVARCICSSSQGVSAPRRKVYLLLVA